MIFSGFFSSSRGSSSIMCSSYSSELTSTSNYSPFLASSIPTFPTPFFTIFSIPFNIPYTTLSLTIYFKNSGVMLKPHSMASSYSKVTSTLYSLTLS